MQKLEQYDEAGKTEKPEKKSRRSVNSQVI